MGVSGWLSAIGLGSNSFMFYAIVYLLVIEGTQFMLVEPVATLYQCREIAAVMRKNKDETYPDAQCVALIPDK